MENQRSLVYICHTCHQQHLAYIHDILCLQIPLCKSKHHCFFHILKLLSHEGCICILRQKLYQIDFSNKQLLRHTLTQWIIKISWFALITVMTSDIGFALITFAASKSLLTLITFTTIKSMFTNTIPSVITIQNWTIRSTITLWREVWLFVQHKAIFLNSFKSRSTIFFHSVMKNTIYFIVWWKRPFYFFRHIF